MINGIRVLTCLSNIDNVFSIDCLGKYCFLNKFDLNLYEKKVPSTGTIRMNSLLNALDIFFQIIL